jgi:hypothetical protein
MVTPRNSATFIAEVSAYASKDEFVANGMVTTYPSAPFDCCICQIKPSDLGNLSPLHAPFRAEKDPSLPSNVFHVGSEENPESFTLSSPQGYIGRYLTLAIPIVSANLSRHTANTISKSNEGPSGPKEVQELVILRPCPYRHYFCRDCVMEWIDHGHTCPLCRTILFEVPSDNEEEEEGEEQEEGGGTWSAADGFSLAQRLRFADMVAGPGNRPDVGLWIRRNPWNPNIDATIRDVLPRTTESLGNEEG